VSTAPVVATTASLTGGLNVGLNWYAVHTRSRHEKLVAHHLHMRGVCGYLPTRTEIHRWSDRQKKIEVPLFAGYIFVHLADCNERRVEVLRTPGVVGFVGTRPQGTPIPDEQIESVRILGTQNLALDPHPFIKEGQRVRVRGGALDGMEGIFVRRNGHDSLVISIDAIQRSLSVSIQGYDVQVLPS
jgi:transcription antitermination factor NusG